MEFFWVFSMRRVVQNAVRALRVSGFKKEFHFILWNSFKFRKDAIEFHSREWNSYTHRFLGMSWMGRSSRRVVGIPLSVMEFSSEVISLCSIYFNLELDLIISESLGSLVDLYWNFTGASLGLCYVDGYWM